MKSYEEVMEVNVWEVKELLLSLRGVRCTNLERAILFAADLAQIKSHLRKNEKQRQVIFSGLKQKLFVCDSYNEIEYILVVMKHIIPFNDKNYTALRNRIETGILNDIDTYFTKDEYQLLRHLYPYSSSRLEEIMNKFDNGDDKQKGLLCEIYLIEQNYKKAYTYLKDCDYSEILRKYDHELKYNNFIKYKKYALKQPLFKFDHYGNQTWMKKQLKF